MNIAQGEQSPLANLLRSGDVDKAAQMAYAVLSMVDKTEEEMGSDDRKSVSPPGWMRHVACQRIGTELFLTSLKIIHSFLWQRCLGYHCSLLCTCAL